MRAYPGRREGAERTYLGRKESWLVQRGNPWRAYVSEDGRERPLQHHLHHSPDGHSWGYGGSGPSELAKDILWDLLGERPAPGLYQAFKMAYVAQWPQDEPWSLSEAEILGWLGDVGASVPALRVVGEGEGR